MSCCFFQERNETRLSSFIVKDGVHTDMSISSTKDLNHVLAELIGDYMEKLYLSDDDDGEARLHSAIERTAIHGEDAELPGKPDQLSASDRIMRDLFLWSILMNYVDMAKVFLANMKYRICPALLATKILKKYYKKAPYGDLKESYMKSAEYFEQYAIECITLCESHDPNRASEIVVQQIELYGNVTCLQVCENACRTVVAPILLLSLNMKGSG